MKVILIPCFLAALASCSSTKPKAAPDHYTARGKITALPPTGAKVPELEIHHETLPTFRNQQGAVSGMSSMPMPFLPDAGVSLTGLAVGDKVAFSFDVVWDDRSPLHLTQISKLPADTALTLE